jgi:membrane fusion protein, multidrug efflux system
MWKKERFILIFLALPLVFSLVGCGSQSTANAEENKTEETIPVEVATVEKGDIAAYFLGTATLEAESEADVVAKTGGIVEQIFVEEGEKVKKGQVLAQLDDDKLTLDLKEAEARLKQLEGEFKRNRELHGKHIISTEIFERIKSDFEMQKAKVELARLLKDYTSIRAPIGGVVAKRMIKVGNMVPQNEPCFHITDFDPLLAVLHAPEKEMSKLEKNQKAFLEVDALPGETFSGKILRISPVVDAQTGTFKVTVAVTDPRGTLKPGMFSRVRIVHDVRNDILLLPKDAVLNEGDESVVFLVKDNVVHRKTIGTGYVNTTCLEIRSGLDLGDTVVRTGISGLKDGSKVEILEPQQEGEVK